ncbi:T9SS type A sorting domain-containing protein [Pontibacter fetidus]|uniref:T9SS type A sorting domain-containing protein n=1 Tax=Pontibacter fetidus TaxID=2700082 RepID=A0A6B2H367_9BACT|nr:T9SS type A sorting domain-containing protein [Pontibacter fetidus]NDK56841.1 T9SS type A sorting domain-containing protein [Pontibacter fetidus]
MKSTLRIALALSATMLFFGTANAQKAAAPLSATSANAAVLFNEPTIDGTLDVIPDLSVNNQASWDIFITAGDRAGEKVNVKITLADPAQRQNFTMEHALDASGTTWEPVTFNAEGVAIVGPQGGKALANSQEYFRVTFTQAGIYKYRLDLLRDDDNVIATKTEATRVSTVAGTDDMIADTRIMAYPTISSGTINVDLGQLRNAEMHVVDMLGRSVYSASKISGTTTIDTRRFGKGLYFVKVIKDGDAAALRFIVQ